jgi:adenylate kinase family enzyme
MPRLVIVISGPVGAGKTELASRLARAFRGAVVSTRQVLADEYLLHHRDENRGRLQELGDQLDRETGGRWVAEATAGHTKFFRPNGVIVVDAVRQQSQINELRVLVTPRVLHVHVTASEEVLTKRYRKKQEARSREELPSFPQVRANPTEAQIEELGSRAIMRINTGRWWPSATAARARLKIRRANLWYRRRSFARSVALGVFGVAVTVAMVLGAPVLDVTEWRPETALVIVYVFLIIVMGLLLTWALSPQSPVAGLPRRRASKASRADDEAQP